VVLLRMQRPRSRSVVVAGLGAGVASLLSAVGSVLVIDTEWRDEVAVALLLAGAIALALPVGSARVRRLGDVLETACLVAVPPLLVVAVGLPTHLPG
jgi:hypothetical protein